MDIDLHIFLKIPPSGRLARKPPKELLFRVCMGEAGGENGLLHGMGSMEMYEKNA